MERKSQVVAPLSGKRQDGNIQGYALNPAAVQQAGAPMGQPPAPGVPPTAGAPAAPAQPGVPAALEPPKKDFSKVEELADRVTKLGPSEQQAYAQQFLSLSQQYPELQAELYALYNALQHNSDPRTQTQGLPTVKDTMAKLKNKISMDDDLQEDGMAPPRQATAKKAPAAQAGAAGQQGAHKRKDHGGDPFKVLLGMCFKLKKRGVSNSRIKRYVLKDSVFDERTIDKAIEVVEDSERDDHQKELANDQDKGFADGERRPKPTKPTMGRDVPEAGQETIADPTAKAGKARLLSKGDLDRLVGPPSSRRPFADDEKSDRLYSEIPAVFGDLFSKGKDARASFNLASHLRTAKKKKGDEGGDGMEALIREESPETDFDKDAGRSDVYHAAPATEESALYTAPRELAACSLGDLLSSYRWLRSLQGLTKDTPQGDRKPAADKGGAADKVRALRAELKRRGMAEGEIEAHKGDE